MGQLLSSEEEFIQVKEAVGSLLFNAMSEGGAIPDVTVLHPFLLTNLNQGLASQDRLQQQLQQLQDHIGNRAPTYLRDLIGRLSAFTEEPRVTGLVGCVVTMVIDMAYSSSRQPTGVKLNATSCQRIVELQEVMEEYLKRCRINLSDKRRLMEDTVRLEAQLSLTLTQLMSCLLRGDCSSRSLRLWASAAAFHTRMLEYLAALEGKPEPLSARAALERYKEDLTQIIPEYRCYKTNTVVVVKCRGGCLSTEVPEEGSMTGLTVTDRELVKSVTIPLSSMQTEMERRRKDLVGDSASILNLDLISSDQYAEAYLDHLFSDEGPVAALQKCFTRVGENLSTRRTGTETSKKLRQSRGERFKERVNEGAGETERRERRREELEKLSIVETQPEESLTHIHHSVKSA
ncbi:uncharacterized protein LOC114477084 isoform X2 [Gouania willdenowi]|uniref:uncharacterized protein LOC114477084 isoform X2 n=1 Tax=Gouania willdenowi TaxID=441366 RepID=UPI00105473B3|nr:uncharacterized protein LOC114477084 isoform X2 [Gouania willdenowi]